MRLRLMVLATITVAGVTAGPAAAQQPVPTVTVTASPTAAAVDATGPVPSGPTRLNFVRPAGATKELDAYVALLVPGVTIEQLQKTMVAEEKTEGESSLGLVSIQASALLPPGKDSAALTFNVKPGLTYVLAIEQPDDKKPTTRSITTFTSGTAANGATAPAPAATVRMEGLRFHAPSTFKQSGTIRFENRDGVAHFALAFPLRPGTTTAQLAKGAANEKAFNKIAAGEPFMAQNVLSGGDTANDQEIKFPKKGRYGLLCFIDGHNRLGMYKLITVK
jgi:plastocyanin